MRLVTLSDPRSPAAEAYRTLRTNIQFSSLDRPLRTLLITSAGADEGKSTTLCNLAVTMAQAGTNLIVADCDLRQPSIHEVFRLGNDKGLTTVLLGETEGELPLQQTPIPNLMALTAGPPPPNPGDILGSQRMRRVMDALSASADLVLFDSPPIGLVTDAAMLASRADGVILVIRAGKTRRETACRAREILQKVNARVLGVVLNDADVGSSFYRYRGASGR